MSASARTRRLVVMTKNGQNPAYTGSRIGADRVAARYGCALTHAVPEKPDDVDEQHALLRAVHTERPDAVLIAPAHATLLNGTLRAMQADGIHILCFVSRPDAFEPTCFVGSHDRALARDIGHYLFDRLEGGRRVVSLEGHPDAITTAPSAAMRAS
jgi:ribose transport system substrate-binding protein